VAWRERVIAFDPTREEPRAFLDETCAPATLVAILESLVQEGCLARRAATAIEEKLLAHVTAHGDWNGRMSRLTEASGMDSDALDGQIPHE
jgi:hypothetical protein